MVILTARSLLIFMNGISFGLPQNSHESLNQNLFHCEGSQRALVDCGGRGCGISSVYSNCLAIHDFRCSVANGLLDTKLLLELQQVEIFYLMLPLYFAVNNFYNDTMDIMICVF